MKVLIFIKFKFLQAALEVHKQLLHSPSHIWTNIAAKNSGLGVFSKTESITDFPFFADLADTPQCAGIKKNFISLML